MKRFFAKLALAALPVALYLCFFVAFEPNNYFGLKGADSAPDSIIAKLRAFDAEMPANILLGDSRMAHFDPAAVEAAAGAPYASLAFGGARLEESLDLLEYALDRDPNLSRAVLGLSFYTLNEGYASVSRMATIEAQLKNPLAYIFNLEYNVNAVSNLAATLQGQGTTGRGETAVWGPADYLDGDGAPLPLRRDLIVYAAKLYANCARPGVLPAPHYNSEGVCDNGKELYAAMLACTPADSRFAVNEAQLARLEALAARCEKAGVELVLVLPPMDESVRTLVCEPLGIDDAMAPALARLSALGVRVIDNEWADPPLWPDTLFFDGFHVDEVYGLPGYTNTLFKAVSGYGA